MYRMFKHIADKIVAFIALLALSPIFLICCVLLGIFNKNGLKGVFFIQPRPGENERVFKLFKFKTMTDERDEYGNLLPDEQRLTWVGRIIRKTSIDEIPQLLNILKGEMSFIGPRPLLLEYLPLYSDEQRRRHDVRPGISGWAQVNGRNAISWEKKFELDVWYVDHQSFWLDLKILFLTLIKVLKAEGISGENVATMEKFKGSQHSTIKTSN
ncbi:Lipid carrier : UDP-N-acetylgalactosaminyltransferase [Fulvivirga imtechensis AK7]|uniref:Lipid carrier: UDP-N-acetylgalactosaminyltransferase n=2 Tax=Fulvivirga TaxID=396811 RepID=L8JP48_9BACT|nr:sugar transferase [Fulvivirga imtechensis]ELR70615.1 Lipid carrier : UDP-N-acetylgalactosaminyltransferase [Fulvivirga imtechensis AK7]